MSGGEGTLIDKSESSSFEDLAAAAAHEIEEAKLAEAAAASVKPIQSDETKTKEWHDVLGSGALLKQVRNYEFIRSLTTILSLYLRIMTTHSIKYYVLWISSNGLAVIKTDKVTRWQVCKLKYN